MVSCALWGRVRDKPNRAATRSGNLLFRLLWQEAVIQLLVDLRAGEGVEEDRRRLEEEEGAVVVEEAWFWADRTRDVGRIGVGDNLMDAVQ